MCDVEKHASSVLRIRKIVEKKCQFSFSEGLATPHTPLITV